MARVVLYTATCEYINIHEIMAFFKKSYTLVIWKEKEGAAMTGKHTNLYVFVEMDRLVVDVVPHEEVVDTRKEGHLREGEDVHELLHCVAMYALHDRDNRLCNIFVTLMSNLLQTSVKEIVTLP